jgi:hypothetical protein
MEPETSEKTNEIQSKLSDRLDNTEPAYSLSRYFIIVRGNEYAKCRLCSSKIKRKQGNTKGMIGHLRIHQAFFKEFEEAKAKLTKKVDNKVILISSNNCLLNYVTNFRFHIKSVQRDFLRKGRKSANK